MTEVLKYQMPLKEKTPVLIFTPEDINNNENYNDIPYSTGLSGSRCYPVPV